MTGSRFSGDGRPAPHASAESRYVNHGVIARIELDPQEWRSC
jgi:hypothetical protein